MPRPIDDRLARLRTRRKGIDRVDQLSLDARLEVLSRSVTAESYQTRGQDQQRYTRYALGAMQEVGPDYTAISIDTAERVGKQLDQGLAALGQPVEFRLQGSVPLNVHIRGVSDVDLLTLDKDYLTYAKAGNLAAAGHYSGPSTRSSLTVLSDLRRRAEGILKEKYPAAKVDTSGGKAIAISGGSLQRPVDVVPSHWYDTMAYQSSQADHDRAITILDKNKAVTLDNWPFLHIKNIHDRDAHVIGGLKKAIRLCKNVKADAVSEGTSISLPSFDIAAALFHADQAALISGYVYELGILAEAQRFMDYLTMNEVFASSLRTPDGSRIIFDTPEKLSGLRRLSIELDDLAREVAKEQSKLLREQVEVQLSDSRETLKSVFVPG